MLKLLNFELKLNLRHRKLSGVWITQSVNVINSRYVYVYACVCVLTICVRKCERAMQIEWKLEEREGEMRQINTCEKQVRLLLNDSVTGWTFTHLWCVSLPIKADKPKQQSNLLEAEGNLASSPKSTQMSKVLASESPLNSTRMLKWVIFIDFMQSGGSMNK